MDANVQSILQAKAAQYGIPYEYVYAVVMNESGGNPKAIGDNGNSYGLFQINKPSHPKFDTTRYTDVTYQADTQIPTLAATYKDGLAKGLSGAELAQYIERYGERPVWTTNVANRITKFYNDITGGKVAGVTTTTQDGSYLTNSAAVRFPGDGKPVPTSGGQSSTDNVTNGLDWAQQAIFWGVTVVIFAMLIFGFGYTGKELLK